MHVAPATRRWTARLALAVAVAVATCYVPAAVLARDPRVPELRSQAAELERQIELVERHNRQMTREIEALRIDVATIERRARADLGMVYPNELVVRLEPGDDSTPPAPAPAKAPPGGAL